MRREHNPIKTFAALILVALVLVSGAALGPAEAQQGGAAVSSAQAPGPPEIEAESWALIDAETGKYLEGENPDEPLPLASTTKMMAALVALEDGVDLSQEVVVSPEAASYATPPYSNVGLYPYDQVSMEELIQAILIPSGIDAVYALSETLGGGSTEQFMARMNEEASEMGLENTHFENPAGIDAEGQYSSARDLATLAQVAMEYPLFAETVDTIETTITTQDREIRLVNTNTLLGTYPPATGVKTGTSDEAGAVLVSSASSDNESYIAVVMDAEDRYAASEALLEYAFGRYDRDTLVSPEEVYGEVAPPYRPDESVELAATDEVLGLVNADSEVEREVTTREELPSSADAGDELGEVEVSVDGESIGTSPLVAQEGYEEASIWRRIRYTAGDLLDRAQGALAGLTG
ncbi:serine-type D-Ala-D-Ala carboxypeptidase DacF [soil metagenome]